MRDVVEEIDGVFVLPLAGFVCRGFKDSAGGVELILESQDLEESAKILVNDPVFRDRVVALAGERRTVRAAVASKESTLKVDFDAGAPLEVPAGRYEDWEVVGPGRVCVVSPAGVASRRSGTLRRRDTSSRTAR